MAKRLLVIDSDDKGHFFLAVDAGTMMVGADRKNAEFVLRDLHVVRIHCEVEVDEDAVVVTNGDTSGALPVRRELYPGDAVHSGHARVSLLATADDSTASLAATADQDLPQLAELALAKDAPTTAAAPAPPAVAHAATGPTQPGLSKRLFVIDGADQGRSYRVAESGSTKIGNSHKHADIVLHDLYVARLHCELQAAGDRIVVTHRVGHNGTLINGKRISQEELHVGDVLRVGNSHLRLEFGEASDHPVNSSQVDTEVIPIAEIENSSAAPAKKITKVKAPGTPGSAEHAALPPSPVDQLLKLEGQILGHFHLGTLLGRGHSGLVFRALDHKSNQVAALKVLSPDFPTSDAELQGFVRALKVCAPLHHAHLVSLYGAGRTGTHCWIAREHVEGESLAALIQRLHSDNKLGWKRACRVAVHLGKALEFLHEHQVIHGNITPWNVLIKSDTKTTKLADSLLEKALQGSRVQKAVLENKLLHELPYRAPEQIEAGTVDGRADLYALGIVLYTLLTGQSPFPGDSPNNVLAQIREAKVVKPTKILRDIPPPFEAAVLKMLARRPEDRYQTAAELLSVVESIANMHEIKV
jgi:pSer/pThr/pTyr-binding forkhead associated (FHA) protein